jgi:hypothetical protein
LWLGADHLLAVDSTLATEEYRRFYFRDIEAIVIRQTAQRQIWNWVLVVLLLLMAGPFFFAWLSARDGTFLAASIGCALFWLVFIAINTLRGATCQTHIRTAAQTEQLPSLGRLPAHSGGSGRDHARGTGRRALDDAGESQMSVLVGRVAWQTAPHRNAVGRQSGLFGHAVSFRNRSVRHRCKKLLKVFSASLRGLAPKEIERCQSGQLLGGGAGEELIDGIAFPIDQGLNAAVQWLRKLHGERFHGVDMSIAKNSRGVTARTPN